MSLSPPAFPSRSVLGLTVTLALAAASCGTPTADDTAQRAVMNDLAHEVMLPIYDELEQGALPLPPAVAAFCDGPTEATLTAAQAAWRAARVPWKHAEAFRFGPVEDLRIGSAIDFWPARTDSIESAITAAPEPVTTAHIASLGVSTKGLPALEFLLFDPAGGNAAVLASLGGADAAGKKRCAYARALADAIAADTTTAQEAWSLEGGAFVNQVAKAGSGSTLFLTGQDGIARVVNLLIAAMIAVSENRVSRPLGIVSGTGPDPTLVESRFSDDSIEDLFGTLRGVEDVYLGRHGDRSGRGISELVAARSPAIDSSVKKAFTDAMAATSAVPAPLRTAITDHPAAVTKAQDALRVVRRLLSTDVASVLGVAVTLSDNDGD
ncbi:imelysin family protein [Polyangium sorediatum]|uniref:Imelysin family protein n=1 Tax=Polyangium sorediatum TaxID=889274 RepID=A0ABT6P4U2_9BACT|nr:imelysin family protein [Polyangium sorediatum]MDI1435630.1 imelysin family protein [Polyangium sorediatum]